MAARIVLLIWVVFLTNLRLSLCDVMRLDPCTDEYDCWSSAKSALLCCPGNETQPSYCCTEEEYSSHNSNPEEWIQNNTALFLLFVLVIAFGCVVSPILCLCKNWQPCPMARNKDKERILLSEQQNRDYVDSILRDLEAAKFEEKALTNNYS